MYYVHSLNCKIYVIVIFMSQSINFSVQNEESLNCSLNTDVWGITKHLFIYLYIFANVCSVHGGSGSVDL